MAATILDQIVETKRMELAEAMRLRGRAEVESAARQAAAPRDFHAAVTDDADGIRLIAEIKKASPSAGLIRDDFDPVSIAETYQSAGAAALSVLTDATYFQGSPAFIAEVKAASQLPVLRKDFTIDAYQVFESRAIGADAILLIAAILEAEQIEAWSKLACELGMASIIEVHDETEYGKVAESVSADRRSLLGINNRDLHIQQTNLDTTHRLAALLPMGTPFIAESGIRTREDVAAIRNSGATAMLVGETLMRAEDPGTAIRQLLGA